MDTLKSKAAKVGKAATQTAGGAVKGLARTAGNLASSVKTTTATKAEVAIKNAKGPSPNPMTNMIITDIAMRGGGSLLRRALEHAVLGAKYTPEKAREITKGRTMTQTLVGTAVARIATRSIPGALIVGGGLLAKTLYDRARNRGDAKAEGEAKIEDQARRA